MPVKPATGVTEMPVVVTVIFARDLNSSITALEREMFRAVNFKFADCDELIVSVFALSDAPNFSFGISMLVEASVVAIDVSDAKRSR